MEGEDAFHGSTHQDVACGLTPATVRTAVAVAPPVVVVEPEGRGRKLEAVVERLGQVGEAQLLEMDAK